MNEIKFIDTKTWRRMAIAYFGGNTHMAKALDIDPLTLRTYVETGFPEYILKYIEDNGDEFFNVDSMRRSFNLGDLEFIQKPLKT